MAFLSTFDMICSAANARLQMLRLNWCAIVSHILLEYKKRLFRWNMWRNIMILPHTNDENNCRVNESNRNKWPNTLVNRTRLIRPELNGVCVCGAKKFVRTTETWAWASRLCTCVVWVSFSSFSLHQTRSAENVEQFISKRIKTVKLCVWEKFYGSTRRIYFSYCLAYHFMLQPLLMLAFFAKYTMCLCAANCVQNLNTNANTTLLEHTSTDLNNKCEKDNQVIVKQLFYAVNE